MESPPPASPKENCWPLYAAVFFAFVVLVSAWTTLTVVAIKNAPAKIEVRK